MLHAQAEGVVNTTPEEKIFFHEGISISEKGVIKFDDEAKRWFLELIKTVEGELASIPDEAGEKITQLTGEVAEGVVDNLAHGNSTTKKLAKWRQRLMKLLGEKIKKLPKEHHIKQEVKKAIDTPSIHIVIGYIPFGGYEVQPLPVPVIIRKGSNNTLKVIIHSLQSRYNFQQGPITQRKERGSA